MSQHFIPLASDSTRSDDLDGTNRVHDGRVVIEDDEVDFPLIRLGVSDDHGSEAWGYIREYALLTPSECRKIAAGLYKAARASEEYIKATGFSVAQWMEREDQ
jgi:hypothetical protein